MNVLLTLYSFADISEIDATLSKLDASNESVKSKSPVIYNGNIREPIEE